MTIIIEQLKALNSTKTIGYIMIFVAGTLWGTIGLFVKLLTGIGASSALTAFIRLFLAFWILLPVMFHMGGKKMFKIDKYNLLKCFLLGFLSQALYNYTYNIAIGNIGIATASILLYTSPIFVCVISAIFFKEYIGKQKILAIVINLFGCFLMVTGGNIGNLKLNFVGIIFGVAAGFLYSLVAIIGNIVSDEVHPFTVVFYSFLFGWLSLVVIAKPWESIEVMAQFKFWLYAFGFALIPTVGSYLFYMSGLRKNLELSKVPIIASIEMVVSALIGGLIFRESIGLINILGVIFLLISIAVMNIRLKSNMDAVNKWFQ